MKLTILGATGRTGRHIVEQALAAGHDVTVLVRSRAKLGAPGDRVTVVEGDLSSQDDVRRAVEGSDGVMYAAGPVKGGPADLSEVAARNAVIAMKEAGVSRIVWLSGAAVRDPRDGGSGSRVIVRAIMKLFAGKLLGASERAYEEIINSGLAYTVVRPPMLADDPGGRNLQASYEPPKPIPLGRADLASFMLSAVESSVYVGESPLIGYTERLK